MLIRALCYTGSTHVDHKAVLYRLRAQVKPQPRVEQPSVRRGKVYGSGKTGWLADHRHHAGPDTKADEGEACDRWDGEVEEAGRALQGEAGEEEEEEAEKQQHKPHEQAQQEER
ncbi:MAG: hypothetical protein SGPRY_009642 [Prymnesium sp.]